MESLKQITAKKLVQILPRECLDQLVNADIKQRTVYLVEDEYCVHRVFSDYDKAVLVAKTVKPLKVVLDTPIRDKLFVALEHGSYFIYNSKKQVRADAGKCWKRGHAACYSRSLIDGEWQETPPDMCHHCGSNTGTKNPHMFCDGYECCEEGCARCENITFDEKSQRNLCHECLQ